MTWSDFYLLCFLVGFGLSVLTLLAGSVHMHLPHLHFHNGIHLGHAHGHAGAHGQYVSWFNFGTLAAFLAWFGGTGYLLEHYYGVWFAASLAIATLSGLGGAAVVFWFLARSCCRTIRRWIPPISTWSAFSAGSVYRSARAAPAS